MNANLPIGPTVCYGCTVTVERPNKGHVGDNHDKFSCFVLCREVVDHLSEVENVLEC